MFGPLSDAIDHIQEVDPGALTGPELRTALAELRSATAALEAVQTRMTAAFDASGDWQLDGARSAAAWLAWAHRIPTSVAKSRVATGRSLRTLPAVEAAWLAGDIDGHHVRLLARVRTPVTAECFKRDEELLVDAARTMRYDRFARVVAYWQQMADPDGIEADAEALRERRRAHVSRSFDGLWFGDFVLDPIAGTAFVEQLDRISDELFRADRTDARAADVHGRSPAQRRADALVEMARRAGMAPHGGRRPEPLFTVLVDYETLAGRVCELADGTVVTPGSLLPWLDESLVERVVFDSPSRVIDVGQRSRFFTGATRRAIEVRDRRCFDNTCDAPPHRSQVDHVLPFADGGLTTEANGRLACGLHNRRRNRDPAPTYLDTG